MLFCDHDYVILDKTILESPYEQMSRMNKVYASIPKEPMIFQKKLVMLMKCKICKRLKKIVEINPIG